MSKLIETKLVNSQKSNTSNQKNSQKIKLREQAKQLLLKGCYLMAVNKYIRLIDLGLDQFSPRQKSVIYLNAGICYQFMSQTDKKNFVKALNFMKRAIQADKTYEKTYYRLIQLMRDNQYYENALALVPQIVRNPQIDKLIDEVRALYLKKSDFAQIVNKVKSQQIDLKAMQMLKAKLQEKVMELLEDNQSSHVKSFNGQDFRSKIKRLNQQIEMSYKMISQSYYINGTSIQTVQIKLSDRSLIMKLFCSFLYKLFGIRVSKKCNIMLIDAITQSMMKQFRGALKNFMQEQKPYNKMSGKLSVNSKFLNSNTYVNIVIRKSLQLPEIWLIQWTRLIDTNTELFYQVYSYLVDHYYQKLRTIQKETKCQQYVMDLNFKEKQVHKFLFMNCIDAEEVIRQGTNTQKIKVKPKIVNGGHSEYLYKNITIDQLNLLKDLLYSECNKMATIYQKAFIHPIWLQNLNDILFSLNALLSNIMSCLQIYYSRQAKQIEILNNEITKIQNICHLVYVKHWQTYAYNEFLKNQQNQAKISKRVSQSQQYSIQIPKYSFTYNFESLIQYFERTQQNLISLYLIQQIIQFIQKDTLKFSQTTNSMNRTVSDRLVHKQKIIQISMKKMIKIQQKHHEYIKSTDNKKSNHVYREMYMLLVCIVLKLQPHQQLKVDKNLALSPSISPILTQLSLQVLLLLFINKPSNVLSIYQSPNLLYSTIKHYINKPILQLQQFEGIQKLLNLIYFLVCDFEQDQQKYFAKKLDCQLIDVHNARLIQKDIKKQGLKEKQQIRKQRSKFVAMVGQQWIEIINQLCRMVKQQMKMQLSYSNKLIKIVFAIAQINHSKLYSNQIIDFMLEARNLKQPANSFYFNVKQIACKFFQIICKKCNVQMFEYKHLQAIADCLLWLLVNNEHELVYFESLLGLENLSTTSIRIPVQQIQKCLYEQNPYIFHAGVCIMNNILIANAQAIDNEQKNAKFHHRISDIVSKYVQFYRDQLNGNFQNDIKESDYSHPKKVYSSLISLATVLHLEKLQELDSWLNAKKAIKLIANAQATDLAFKLAIYFSMQGKLPRNWSEGLQNQLQILKQTNAPKYAKMAQLL